MVICPDCGKEVKDAKFCSNCGSPLPEITEEEVIDPGVANSTKFCSNCGTELDASVVVCPECGFRLIQEEMPQTKFCQNCGQKIDINAEICPYCGIRVAGVTVVGQKSVFLAALLSIILPGLGQIYVGQTTKGISFIVACIVSYVLMIFIIGFILILVIWIWSLVDVIKSTEAINRGEYVEDKLF